MNKWDQQMPDYRDSVAQAAMHVPLSLANVTHRLQLERQARLSNWIAQGTFRRETYATRVAYRLYPDGAVEKLYAV